jgi:hypothetical protein
MKNIIKLIALVALVAGVMPVHTLAGNENNANVPVAWTLALLPTIPAIVGAATALEITSDIGAAIIAKKASLSFAFGYTGILLPLALIPTILTGAGCSVLCKLFCNKDTFKAFKEMERVVDKTVGLAFGILVMHTALYYVSCGLC